MSVKFGPDVRLRARAEFLVVQAEGRRVATKHLTLLGRPNDRGRDRLGIIASKKLGGAIVRNRAKRRIREIFRRFEPDLTVSRGHRPFDLVVIPRREAIAATWTDLTADFSNALRRLRKTNG